MSLHRIWRLIVKEFLQLKRDPLALRLTLVASSLCCWDMPPRGT